MTQTNAKNKVIAYRQVFRPPAVHGSKQNSNYVPVRIFLSCLCSNVYTLLTKPDFVYTKYIIGNVLALKIVSAETIVDMISLMRATLECADFLLLFLVSN